MRKPNDWIGPCRVCWGLIVRGREAKVLDLHALAYFDQAVELMTHAGRCAEGRRASDIAFLRRVERLAREKWGKERLAARIARILAEHEPDDLMRADRPGEPPDP